MVPSMSSILSEFLCSGVPADPRLLVLQPRPEQASLDLRASGTGTGEFYRRPTPPGDGMFDLKGRPGGMVDIEFMLQNGVIWWDGEMIPWRDIKVDLLTHSLTPAVSG